MRTPTILFVAGLLSCSQGVEETTSPVTGDTSGGSLTQQITPGVLDLQQKIPSNLFVISIDTLRKSKLGLYSEDGVPTMPFLESMLEESVRLDDHRSCSNWTFGSVLCVQTGQDNIDIGFVPTTQVDAGFVPDGIEGLPDWLPGDPYSILVSGNSWFSDGHGSAIGFDEVFRPEHPDATNLHKIGFSRLKQHLEDPWYYHLHFIEPHAAYIPPDEYLDGLGALPNIAYDLTSSLGHYEALNSWVALSETEREAIAQHMQLRYMAELAYLDDQIETIFTDMEQRGLLDDTLVVFWSDHGEAFWEHSYQTHAYFLYGEETDTIAAFWTKDIAPAVYEGPTMHQDIVPTILSALGAQVPDVVTGITAGLAEEDRIFRAITNAKMGGVISIQDGPYRIHHRVDLSTSMYNLTLDPGEHDDIYQIQQPESDELWALMEAELKVAAPLMERVFVPHKPGKM